MDALTIGQVARRSGVGVETVRFYERKGLIPVPPRRASGYRQYPEETVRRIRFIRRAKDLGFSLAEIVDLLSLRLEPNERCEDVRGRALAKIEEIDKRLRSLRRMRSTLTNLVRACSEGGTSGACPILEALKE